MFLVLVIGLILCIVCCSILLVISGLHYQTFSDFSCIIVFYVFFIVLVGIQIILMDLYTSITNKRLSRSMVLVLALVISYSFMSFCYNCFIVISAIIFFIQTAFYYWSLNVVAYIWILVQFCIEYFFDISFSGQYGPVKEGFDYDAFFRYITSKRYSLFDHVMFDFHLMTFEKAFIDALEYLTIFVDHYIRVSTFITRYLYLYIYFISTIVGSYSFVKIMYFMLFVIITVDVLLLGEIKMLKKGLRLFLAFLLVVVVLTMLTYIFMFDNYTVVTVNDDIRLYIFNQERSIFLGDNPKYAIITYEFVLPFISDIESVDELRYTLAQYFSYMADTRSVTQDVIDKQHKE